MRKFILWDLDGTVVESEDIAFKRAMFESVTRKINLEFSLSSDEFVGHEAKQIFLLLLKRNQVKNMDDYLSQYENWYEEAVCYIKKNIHKIKARENVIELWDTCAHSGIVQAIVTSSRSDVAKAYMDNIGLSKYCKLIIGVDSVSKPKPSPIPYLTAMQKLGANTQECIAVEDSFSGISAAVEAGIYTLAWVKNKNQRNYSKANKVTESLNYSIIEKAFCSLT